LTSFRRGEKKPSVPIAIGTVQVAEKRAHEKEEGNEKGKKE